jgi:hypothetical protein
MTEMPSKFRATGHYQLQSRLSHGHMQIRQQAQHILNINEADLRATKKVPLDANANELLNGGVKVD